MQDERRKDETRDLRSVKTQPAALCWVSLGVAALALAGLVAHHMLAPRPRLAFVDTNKMLVGFREAAAVEKELKKRDDVWRRKAEVLEDSAKALMDRMSKEYDAASAARKRELQDMLAARNKELANFTQANMRQMEKMKQRKMQPVVDKVNLYLNEYGRENGYAVILAAVRGSPTMLYGNAAYDITDEVIAGLNERYK